MFRIDIDNDRSGKTIKYCSDTVNQSTKNGSPKIALAEAKKEMKNKKNLFKKNFKEE